MPQITATEEETAQTSSNQESTRAEKLSEIMETTQAGIFLSPEGFIMMSTAALVDVVELFIPFEPIDPVDIFAIVFFGAWMVFRAMLKGRKPEVKVSKKAAATIQRAAKWAKRLKWLRPILFILEMIPLVGAAPFWVVAVYLELKHG